MGVVDYILEPLHLATITSAQENAFVFLLVDDDCYWRISHQDISELWIGGYQNKFAPGYTEPLGGWKWITGESFTFTNWHPGEPDNSGDQEALSLYGNGATVADRTPMWDDAYHGSDANISFVVEFNAVPEPSTFVLLEIGIITTPYLHMAAANIVEEQNAEEASKSGGSFHLSSRNPVESLIPEDRHSGPQVFSKYFLYCYFIYMKSPS